MNKEYQSKRKRKKNNTWPIKAILACIFAILIFITYQKGRAFLFSSMISTTLASNSILEEKIYADSLIFAREKVISAPYSGKLKILVANGQRISQSEIFAQLEAFGTTAEGKGVQVDLPAPTAGLMFYWWDGLEKVFTSSILGNSDIKKVFSAAIPKSLGETLHVGEPVAKIVDNLEGIYCVAKYDSNAIKVTPAKDEKLLVSFAGFRTTALVRDYKKDEAVTYLVLQLSDLPRGFANSRYLNCVLIPQQYKGIVLPNEAIVTKNGEIGVYVIKTKKTIWQQVRLVGEVRDEIVVEGLDPTQEIIINPKWVRNGELAN